MFSISTEINRFNFGRISYTTDSPEYGVDTRQNMWIYVGAAEDRCLERSIRQEERVMGTEISGFSEISKFLTAAGHSARLIMSSIKPAGDW